MFFVFLFKNYYDDPFNQSLNPHDVTITEISKLEGWEGKEILAAEKLSPAVFQLQKSRTIYKCNISENIIYIQVVVNALF